MTGPAIHGEDVALFIDWENFKISLATGRRTPNVSALKEEVSNLGRVVVARAYADWVTRTPEIRGASQFINDPPALYAAGIEPVYVPTRLTWGNSASPESVRHTRVKNSVDVKMTADCIEFAHSYSNIGTFVLVSGDSDFIHVINTLRAMGKRVVIIGVSWATSRRLADQVDGLILYDVDVDPVVAPEAVSTGNGRAPSRAGGGTKPDLGAVIREIEEIVRSERQAGGTPLLTSIKQRLMRRNPGFDEKQLGYSGFKKLMARVAQEGNIKLITAGLVDWATMADEPVPPGSEVVTPDSEQVSPGRGRRRSAKPSFVEAPIPEALVPEAPLEDLDSVSVSDTGSEPVEEPTDGDAAASLESVGDGQAQVEDARPTHAMSPSLQAVLVEATSGLDLPAGPGDGEDAERVADLIVMADTLEHREGISHVAFNFLVAEVCQALEQGLEAGYGEITQRWSQVYSRTYVSKMFRGLSSGNLFQRGWHSWRDEVSGQYRRRRTFNLERNHPVVQQVLKDRWEAESSVEAAEPPAELPEPAGIWEAGFSEDAHRFDEDQEESLDGAESKSPPSFLSRLFRPRD